MIKKNILYILVIILVYLLGNYYPILNLEHTVVNIGRGEWYQIIINGVLAFLTFLTILVALFKEEIKRFWIYPNITVEGPLLNEVQNNSLSSSEDIEISSYELVIDLTNNGTESAQDTEIQLESLEYKKDANTKYKDIPVLSTNLKWTISDNTTLQIAPKSKKRVKLFEILPSEQQPGGVGNPENTLKVLGENFDKPFSGGGEWKAHYLISTRNGNHTRFQVELKWNGLWKKRQTEMNEIIDSSLIMK